MFTFNDGSSFEGEFFNGEMKEGKYIFLNGDCYIGSFENGLFNGKGKYFYVNGDQFEGQWVNDKKNGFGKYIFNDGSEIEGQWKDDNIEEKIEKK